MVNFYEENKKCQCCEFATGLSGVGDGVLTINQISRRTFTQNTQM